MAVVRRRLCSTQAHWTLNYVELFFVLCAQCCLYAVQLSWNRCFLSVLRPRYVTDTDKAQFFDESLAGSVQETFSELFPEKNGVEDNAEGDDPEEDGEAALFEEAET